LKTSSGQEVSAVRLAAIRILEAVHRSTSLFAAERIHGACVDGKLTKRDRRFLTELVYGVLRHQLTLDCVIDAYSQRPLAEISHKALEGLRLGVYQLLYLDGVPPFAAIHSTVAAVGDVRVRGFVNGVLRAIDRGCRRLPLERDRGGASPRKRLAILERKVCFFSKPIFVDPEHDEARYLAQVHGHGEELVRRWLQRHGRELAESILRRNNEPPLLFARANLLRGTRDDLLERLRREGLRCDPGNLSASVRLSAPPTELIRSKSFREGYCTVQDETAMKVAPQLRAAAGQKLLDLCAAPGGKATHLAELSGDQAELLAVDRDERRLQRVIEAAQRLQLSSLRTMAVDVLEVKELPAGAAGPFHAVLVDAPCSNSGVLGRRPEARHRQPLEKLPPLLGIQRDLLEWAATKILPGGLLVYSTCSIEPEENADQVEGLRQRHPEFALQGEIETLPASGAGDGGFYAVLQRSE
jgi:16S rRNA (cytosine967-C5)-methyltransferase